MLYFETVSAIMHVVSTHSTPKNIREPLYMHLTFMHITRLSRVQVKMNLFVQKSRLNMKLKSFPAFGSRLLNCVHPEWRKLTKIALKEKFINCL